jgi:hypothetical protein
LVEVPKLLAVQLSAICRLTQALDEEVKLRVDDGYEHLIFSSFHEEDCELFYSPFFKSF